MPTVQCMPWHILYPASDITLHHHAIKKEKDRKLKTVQYVDSNSRNSDSDTCYNKKLPVRSKIKVVSISKYHAKITVSYVYHIEHVILILLIVYGSFSLTD